MRTCPVCGELAPTGRSEVRARVQPGILSLAEFTLAWASSSRNDCFFDYCRCGTCGLLYNTEYADPNVVDSSYSHMDDNTAGVPRELLAATQRRYLEALEDIAPLEGAYLEVGPDVGLATQLAVEKGSLTKVLLVEPNRDCYADLKRVTTTTNSVIIASVSDLDDSVQVDRIDLTVDVETPEITQQVLAVAQRGLRSPRQKVNTYQDPSGALETVRVNRKTKPNLSIYDKAKESRTGPPRIRFEVQLDRPYLRDNIPTLGHLTERTARISFQHQMKPVINALKGDKRRLDDLRLDRAEKKTVRELCGHEWLRDHDYNDTPTKSEQKRYRDFENKYDISWVGDLF